MLAQIDDCDIFVHYAAVKSRAVVQYIHGASVMTKEIPPLRAKKVQADALPSERRPAVIVEEPKIARKLDFFESQTEPLDVSVVHKNRAKGVADTFAIT